MVTASLQTYMRSKYNHIAMWIVGAAYTLNMTYDKTENYHLHNWLFGANSIR
jgi:hypothetical protein